MTEQENEQQENVQEEKGRDFKAMAGDAFEQGKRLIAKTAQSGVVQKTIASIKEEFVNGKSWCHANWAKGRYGKFRVMAVAVLCLFALKGLFFGWGTSSADMRLAHEMAAMQKAAAEADALRAKEEAQRAKEEKERAEQEAGVRLLGAMLGGGGGESSSSSSYRSSQPQIHIWTCRKCGRQIQSKWPPSTQMQCRAWSGRNDGTKNCQFSRSD